MLESFLSLSVTDYIYAAITAFVVTQLILIVSKFIKVTVVSVDEGVAYKETNKMQIIKKCMTMFPVDTIYFRGKVFSKGMQVRVTTLQKRIIEGELIGKNDMNILCIMAGQHIIAHEIDKIEDIVEM